MTSFPTSLRSHRDHGRVGAMTVSLDGANLCIGSGSKCDAMLLAIEFGFIVVANDR